MHFLSVIPSFAEACVFIFEKNTVLAKSIVWIATIFITLSYFTDKTVYSYYYQHYIVLALLSRRN